MTTYLNVPFSARAEAKAKGARWDSETRKWFVPIGRDLEPFTIWLPVDPSKLVSQELTTESKGVPLSTRSWPLPPYPCIALVLLGSEV